MSHHFFAPVLSAALLLGCGAARTPLGSVSPLSPRAAGAPHGALAGANGAGTRGANLDADPELAVDRRQLVVRAALAALGRTADGEIALAERALLDAVFGPLSLDARPTGEGPAVRWWNAARPRTGRPRVGDLVRFDGAPTQFGIVIEAPTRGGLEIAAVTRGAVRRVRLDPEHAGVRRRGGAIVNTFLRPRRADDARGTRYLAGELVQGFRTLLD